MRWTECAAALRCELLLLLDHLLRGENVVRELKNKVAAVTGAASGIGRELAIQLARDGCALALADIDEEGLHETADLIGGPSRVTTHTVDVGKRDQVYRFAEEAHHTHGQLDLLINNAAVVVLDSIEDITDHDFEWVMRINFWGVAHGVKAFLPYLKQRPAAHIVNISSVFGAVPICNAGPYCISKSAVTSLTEILSQELYGTTVTVSCVLPGAVKTNIVKNTRFVKPINPTMTRDETIDWFERASLTSAEKAARTIIRGIKKNKMRILIGPDAYVIDASKRLAPVLATKYAGHKMRRLTKEKSVLFT